MLCKECGSQMDENSRFCPNCGVEQNGENVNSSTLGEKSTLREAFKAVDPTELTPADEIEYTIYGDDMQLVEISLDPGKSVVAEAGAMNYMDSQVSMQTVLGDSSRKSETQSFIGKLASAGKRALAGESLFMTLFKNEGDTKAQIAFAAPYPGKIIPVELREFDYQLICQKQAFLCAAKGVSIDLYLQKKLGVGLFGGEGFIMERIVGDGIVFVHAGGTIIKKELAPGQILKVDTGCIVAMDATINYDIAMQNDIKSGLFGGEGLFLATLTGPGSVWLQSLPFTRMVERISEETSQDTGDSGFINNPINEVTGGIGKAIGGIFKF